MTDFFKGVVAGFAAALVMSGAVAGFWFLHERDKELLEYAERQIEIEALRTEYGNRNPYEFLDGVPGVRRAADNAAADFRRKRDEAVERLRSRPLD